MMRKIGCFITVYAALVSALSQGTHAQNIRNKKPLAETSGKVRDMQKITDAENRNLVYVLKITQPSFTIYLSDQNIASRLIISSCH